MSTYSADDQAQAVTALASWLESEGVDSGPARRAAQQMVDGALAGITDLATPIELFNPYHAPPGTGGGQFVSKGGAAGGQQAAAQKQAAAKQQQAQAADRKGDRAQRQALTRKIAGLRQQIAALQAQLPKPKGAKKAAGKAARSPAAAAAAAKRATAAKSKSPTPAKKGVRKMSPATIRAKIAALQATMKADIAQLRAIR